MKKALAILLVTVLTLMLFTGCAGTKGTGGNQEQNGTQKSGEDNKQLEKIKVGLIVAGKLGDNGTNDDIHNGVKKFASENPNVELTVVEPSEFNDNAINARNFARNGFKLVVLGDPGTSEIIPEIAKEYPDTRFIILEGTVKDIENVTCLRFRVAEAAFLTGSFGVLMGEYLGGPAKTGFVGGQRVPALERSQYSFKAGAEYVGGEALTVYVGNFTDVSKAKEIALQMYGSGVKLVQAFAGGAGNGVFQASESLGDDFYSMGGATGQFHISPERILASQVKAIDATLYTACTDFIKGTLGNGIIEQGLKEKSVAIKYSPNIGEKVPQEIKDKILEIENKIISGEIVPPSTEAEYNEFVKKHK